MRYNKNGPNNNIKDFESIKFKARIIIRNLGDGNKKDVKVAVSLKYLSKFWGSFEIPRINCEINLV